MIDRVNPDQSLNNAKLESTDALNPASTKISFDFFIGEKKKPEKSRSISFVAKDATPSSIRNFINSAPNIKKLFQDNKYETIQQRLEYQKPLLIYGRFIFTVPNRLDNRDQFEKYKKNIQLALSKIGSTKTGAKLLQTAFDKGIPVLINVETGNKTNFSIAETHLLIPPKFSRNFDEINIDFDQALIFKNPNGSSAPVPSWLALLHEIGHAAGANDSRNADRIYKSKDLPIGVALGQVLLSRISKNTANYEEDRVLEKYEAPAAREAGLLPRSFYDLPVRKVYVNSSLQIPKI